jgi:hypothetical protein
MHVSTGQPTNGCFFTQVHVMAAVAVSTASHCVVTALLQLLQAGTPAAQNRLHHPAGWIATAKEHLHVDCDIAIAEDGAGADKAVRAHTLELVSQTARGTWQRAQTRVHESRPHTPRRV